MGSDDLTLLGDGCGKAKEKLKYRYCLLCNAGKAKEENSGNVGCSFWILSSSCHGCHGSWPGSIRCSFLSLTSHGFLTFLSYTLCISRASSLYFYFGG